MTTAAALKVPQNIESDMARLKAYYPFRIVWCAHKDGEWFAGANPTRRELNKHSRQGWDVFIWGTTERAPQPRAQNEVIETHRR